MAAMGVEWDHGPMGAERAEQLRGPAWTGALFMSAEKPCPWGVRGRAEGAGMDWGPSKSADKPYVVSWSMEVEGMESETMSQWGQEPWVHEGQVS